MQYMLLNMLLIMLFPLVLFAQNLKPYNNANEMIKDLQKSVKIANQINGINKADKRRYNLLGEAFKLQGIICRKAEITPLAIIQQVFESMRTQYADAQVDYIVFTDGCRTMYGLYR